jgi:hypothetical protein
MLVGLLFYHRSIAIGCIEVDKQSNGLSLRLACYFLRYMHSKEIVQCQSVHASVSTTFEEGTSAPYTSCRTRMLCTTSRLSMLLAAQMMSRSLRMEILRYGNAYASRHVV